MSALTHVSLGTSGQQQHICLSLPELKSDSELSRPDGSEARRTSEEKLSSVLQESSEPSSPSLLREEEQFGAGREDRTFEHLNCCHGNTHLNSCEA